MLIDYRVYCSIYAAAAIVYASSILFVGRDRLWKLTFGGSVATFTVVGLSNYLDWLWS